MSEVKDNNKKNTLIVIIVLAVLALGGYFLIFNKGALTNKSETQKLPATDKYQAVFLTNGQVYFGKLKDEGGNYIKLTDIFYLQSQDLNKIQQKDERNANDKTNLALIKLGKELHAPVDEMNISRQQVLFWEDLKDDGKVAQAIKDYKEKNK